MGKTVLLNEIARTAADQGYRTILIEAHEDKPLGALLAPLPSEPFIRLGSDGRCRRQGEARIAACCAGFVGALKVTVADVTVRSGHWNLRKGRRTAATWKSISQTCSSRLGEAATERNTAVAIFVDEIQYFSQKELGALIMAMHKVQQRQVAAGAAGCRPTDSSGACRGIEVVRRAAVQFSGGRCIVRRGHRHSARRARRERRAHCLSRTRCRKFFRSRKAIPISFRNGDTRRGTRLRQT